MQTFCQILLKFPAAVPKPVAMSSINSIALSSAVNYGLATISAGQQRLNQDAQQVANPEQSDPSALLDLQQASLQAQAGADVIRTSNQMLGSLFNALA